MTGYPLLKPGAYQEAGTHSHPDHPALKGVRCSCGAILFPVQDYGCEVCGGHGDALQPVLLTGAGTLVAAAVVHINVGKKSIATPEVPYVVAEIELADGPLIRALVTDGAEDGLTAGQTMVTTLVDVGNDDEGRYRDLRFKPA